MAGNPKEVKEIWTCQSCHEPIDPDECLLQEEYGYEGEAWGTMFRQPSVMQVLSPCCRDFVINQLENFLPADMVRPENY